MICRGEIKGSEGDKEIRGLFLGKEIKGSGSGVFFWK